MNDRQILQEIIDLASTLIRFPTVTVGHEVRWEKIHLAARFIKEYSVENDLEVQVFEEGKFPAILIGFPDQLYMPVMLVGHYDVVSPEPDDHQFEPVVRGDYLWGRGAADMKTVVATYLVWFKNIRKTTGAFPPINLLLIGNEERGEDFPMGTADVLKEVAKQGRSSGYAPEILIAGERTEENGDRVFGKICTENRGVMRFKISTHGERTHSGLVGQTDDLSARLIMAHEAIQGIANRHLTLSGDSEWRTMLRFPFIQVGTDGIYNVTAERGVLGVEVRAIPQDDFGPFLSEIDSYCKLNSLTIDDLVKDPGVVCDRDNPYLGALRKAFQNVSGNPPQLGRKLAGTSARFAPGGQGIVFGQSGIGPHTKDERHYIPSILPYYKILTNFGLSLREIEES
jgi:acetylornithine deacetylase/succinyl-diaminopimelate desuccinylase-like protein